MPTDTKTDPAGSVINRRTLHEVVETLAPLDRTPCGPGEREAAEWIAARLKQTNCLVEIEDEPSWGGFPPTVRGIGIVGTIGMGFALAGRRAFGSLLMIASAVGLVDEVQNGAQLVRHTVRKQRVTPNVVARTGDIGAANVIVLMAHHDAAQTGMIFDQSALKAAHAKFPKFIEKTKTSPPQWWIGLAAPLAGLIGVLTRKRGWLFAGTGIGLLGTALITDIGRSETVPGANDNLSGVAALVAIAESLEGHPVEGAEVWLVSCGAEETLQDGIRAFIKRHGDELRARNAVCLNFDTVGSPNLGMLDSEGAIWLEEYHGPWFRDLIEQTAANEAVELERGLRSRSSTDSVITSRAGLPSTCLVSLNAWRGLSNYHLPTDTPENLDYDTVFEAARLGDAVIRQIGAKRT